MVCKTIVSWYKTMIGRDYIADGCIHSQSCTGSGLLLTPMSSCWKLLYFIPSVNFLGAKDDWDFRISDLVKIPDRTDI